MSMGRLEDASQRGLRTCDTRGHRLPLSQNLVAMVTAGSPRGLGIAMIGF
jgi:hypothetical protein